MAASFNNGHNSTWYADSGATNHITNDLNNLSVHSGYLGKAQVSVRKGQGLKIANTRSLHLSSSSSPLKLGHILHVPDISSNLLSVNKFDKDNDCIFIFDSHGFSIQDRTSGRILFQGLSKKSLYPFPFFSTITAPTGPAWCEDKC